MRRGYWLASPRHQEGQTLGIVAARLHPYGAAFHRPRLRSFGAAAHGVIKVRQIQIALVIGSREPLRRDAAYPLAPRYVDTKAAGNGLLVLGESHQGHGSISFLVWV